MINLRNLFTPEGVEYARKISGGVKPEGFKKESLRSRIMPMPLPPELQLSLAQRDGAEAIPVVAEGDLVKKYQLVAKPASSYGVPIFAPSSGKVVKITESLVISSFNESAKHIFISLDGLDSPIPAKDDDSYPITAEEFLSKIEASGIGGLGGADFPAHLKLQLVAETGCSTIIVNASECEPFISCDEALIREHAHDVVAGIKLLSGFLNPEQCIVAIESDKTEAIAALEQSIDPSLFTVKLLPPIYPAGNENQVIEVTTDLKITMDQRPSDLGVLVMNAGTVFAISQFIETSRPCIGRITTVAGDPLQTPKNFKALFGTPLPFLFDLCGIDKESHTGTLVGGPMMGVTVHSEQVALNRGSNCVVAKSESWFPASEQESPCIRCGLCAESCPVGLLPQQLYGFSKTQNFEQLSAYNLNDCIDCGACSYICPSKIPLLHYFRGAKTQLNEISEKIVQSNHWQDRFQYHQYRIKKQSDEKRESKNSAKRRKQSSESAGFSKENAQNEIAAAVARVKQRKEALKNEK